MSQKVKKDSGKLLSVNDFPLKLKCQVSEEEYITYALEKSKADWNKRKKKAGIQAAILLLAGGLIVYQGITKQWIYHDLLTVFGILMMGYALFDCFFEYLMFPVLLKKNIKKEFAKDPRFGREMDFCFAEDKMVSFYQGQHQGTFFYDEVLKKEQIGKLTLLQLKNGKTMVFPNRVLEQADQQIQEIMKRFEQ